MKNLFSNLGSVEFDDLFYGATPPAQVGGGKLKHGIAAANFVRGTVLAKGADGKLTVLGTNPSGEVTEDFNGDGTATTFTLTATVKPLSVIGVKVGTAAATVTAYNAQTGVVTLSAAPAAGTKNVHVTYAAAGADVPYGILCDDISVGTTADEDVAIYTAGCFNMNKLTVATGYEISDADIDALRSMGIILRTAIAE